MSLQAHNLRDGFTGVISYTNSAETSRYWRAVEESDGAACEKKSCAEYLRVQGLGFRVEGLGFRVWGSGFRVQG